MGSNTGTVMTLANGIIGVSVLAMPFCFKQCGIVLSILMLICSSFVSRLACHFLLKAAIMARRRNFEFLAFHIFGSTGKFIAELFIIGFLMGTCIAFFVVMGDLGPAIIAKLLGIDNTAALRPSVLIGLAVFVVLPLGLLRNIDSLTAVCTVTIGFYGCLVLKVMSEAMPHLVAGDWMDEVHYWRPAGIMQCIPIFSMALFCQTQLFEIYESLHNASLERMNNVIQTAVNMCTGVYICVGFFGYIAYCTQTFSGNIMMSFTPSSVSEIIKVGFVLSVGVSFPLVIFPCRASLYSLLFRRHTGVPHHEVVSGHIPETRFKCLTVFIISMALLVGLLIPNIELVLGLVGSTIGVLICVMFPAAAFICISSKSSYERLLAQALLFVGVLILVLGTYATLYAANDIPPEKVIVAAEMQIDKVVDKPVVEVLPDPVAEKEIVEPKVKMKENVVELPATARQEPPVPIEPAADPKEAPVPAEPIADPKVPPAAAEALVDAKVPQGPVESAAAHKEPEEAKLLPVAVERSSEPKAVAQNQQKEEVHQDAIRKEDEELAEAEKQVKDESQKKDAELLRKLEAHKEEQKKLLQEQKQILQALQEHKKDMERSKLEQNLTAGKSPVDVLPKNAIGQDNVKPVSLQEEVKVPMMNVISNSEDKILQKNSAIQDKMNFNPPEVDKVPGKENVMLVDEIKDSMLKQNPAIVEKDKQDLLRKEEDVPIPGMKELPKKSDQQDIPVLQNEVIKDAGRKQPVAPQIARLEPGAEQESKIQSPVSRNFLMDRLKNTVNLKKPDGNAEEEAKVVREEEAKVLRRDILHQPNSGEIVQAQHQSSPNVAKEAEVLKQEILHQLPPAGMSQAQKKSTPDIAQEAKAMRREILLHDREKRDTEEEICTAPSVNIQPIEQSPNGLPQLDASDVKSKVRPLMIQEETGTSEKDHQLIKSALFLSEPKVEPLKLDEVFHSPAPLQDIKPMKRDLKSVTDQNVSLADPTIDPTKSEEKDELNILQAIEQKLDPQQQPEMVQDNSFVEVLKSTSSQNNSLEGTLLIEKLNMSLATGLHLSELKAQDLPQESKPMKRDLKSVDKED